MRKLPEIFARIASFAGQAEAPAVYLASIDMHQFFDGLHAANHIDLGTREPLASIWMGTRTRIAAHNDVPDNLAVVAVGHGASRCSRATSSATSISAPSTTPPPAAR